MRMVFVDGGIWGPDSRQLVRRLVRQSEHHRSRAVPAAPHELPPARDSGDGRRASRPWRAVRGGPPTGIAVPIIFRTHSRPCLPAARLCPPRAASCAPPTASPALCCPARWCAPWPVAERGGLSGQGLSGQRHFTPHTLTQACGSASTVEAPHPPEAPPVLVERKVQAKSPRCRRSPGHPVARQG